MAHSKIVINGRRFDSAWQLNFYVVRVQEITD